MLSWLFLACSPPPPCEGPTAFLYDPQGSPELLAWPDDAFTTEDPSSPTGRRLEIRSTAWFDQLPELIQGAIAPLHGKTGFGTQAEIVLRFSDTIGDIPSISRSTEDEGLQLWDLDAERRVPYEARVSESGRQLHLLPVGPLRPATRYAAILTGAFTDAAGRCIAPGPTLGALLTREADEPLTELERPLRRALRTAGLHRNEVGAMLHFTTHADHLPYLGAMDEARSAPQSWGAGWSCTDETDFRVCETSFEPIDFRGDDQLVEPGSTARYRLPVRVWLPHGVERPPLVFYGHGLGQSREAGDAIAAILAPRGFAVVGVDAVFHGDHPSTGGSPSPEAFLGIDRSEGIAFDLHKLRSSFDQSNLDRRQLLSLLLAEPDLDGDGTPEFDPDRIAYLGLSLGGILGSGLLVGADEIDAAVLAIAGGNLVTIVRDGEFAATFLPLLENLVGGPDALEMTFSLFQTAIDPSDPVLYASLVSDGSTRSGPPPHLLLPVATEDEIVPFRSGLSLARAYPLPLIEPAPIPVEGLPAGGEAPVQGNWNGTTAGYFQYDRITRSGEVLPSEHLMPYSEEFPIQLLAFLESWAEGGPPVIVDPYAELQTPPLP